MKVSETLSEVKNYINGKFERNGQNSMDVLSPLDGSRISSIPLSTTQDVDNAVQAAKKAFPEWSNMTLKERVQIFFRYRNLLEENMDELTKLVQLENGKTYGEAKAEVEKSMELCEFAVSMPQIVVNEIQEVSKGVECRIERKPLGVVASITPFNFPNMVPHWTLPNALVLGNTMVMKPSELVPLSTVRMAELLKEAGLPDGVFNIVNGGKEVVEAICDHEDIKAVSFVGSTKVAKIVYGAKGVEFSSNAKIQLRRFKKQGWDHLSVCMAKTQYSLSDNPKKLGRPEDFIITIRELRPSVGAGFIVALTGDVMTMPGLPKKPAALNMDITKDGEAKGLF